MSCLDVHYTSFRSLISCMSCNAVICLPNLCTREINSNVIVQAHVISIYTSHISILHTYKNLFCEKNFTFALFKTNSFMILKTEQINPHPRRRHLPSAEAYHVTKNCFLAVVLVIGYKLVPCSR